MSSIEEMVGKTASLTFDVGVEDTAQSLLSGDLAVLGTPRLVAWVEAATVAVLRDWLPSGHTSVGTAIEVAHLAPTPVGATVEVRARVAGGSEKAVDFQVWAKHWAGKSDRRNVLTGRITRAIVSKERFVARVASMERS